MTWHMSRGESRSEAGQATPRTAFVLVGGLALAGIGVGCVGIITGGGGGTTTTTAAPTTTTAATTTTVASGDPCAAENPTSSGFPCTANTGVHGVTFTAANTTNHDSSTCTVCPTGMTWSAGGGYSIGSCVTIDRWKITGDVNINASNGTHTIFGTEAAAIAGSCVKLTHDLFAPPGPGKANDVVIDVGFSGGGKGPVYLADSEVFGTNPSAGGQCGTDSGGAAIPCNSGFSYTVSDTNLHLWRDYLHGTSQGLDSDGYSEMHDSYARADRSDQVTINNGGNVAHCKIVGGIGVAVASGGAGIHDNCSGHGDAYFQDSGGSGPWELIDHSTLFCGATMLFCSRDGAFYGDNSAPDGGVVSNNLFKGGGGVTFCVAPGIDGGSKPFPTGVNLNFKNNVFEINGPNCTHTGSVDNGWNGATIVSAHNDHWCNNRLSDGTLVNATLETGSCP